MAALIDARHPALLGPQVHVHVLLEALNGQPLTIQVHLAALAQDTGQIVHSLAHQGHSVLLQALHAKLGEVGVEGDGCPVVSGLACRDLGLILGRHVVAEHLAVALLTRAITGLNDELGGEDVGQLCTIAVAATCDLLLIVIIVGAGEKMTKDELRHIDTLLFVDLNGHTIPIVPHLDLIALRTNLNLDGVHARVPDFVVSSIHQDLIENLV
mmetsp:Transcript_15656/g.33943  ORF Transcript_15656/g.33943 Transcript_15656/m.33943 type:complete len:212 (-) Transcript_15656:444-1079(-)